MVAFIGKRERLVGKILITRLPVVKFVRLFQPQGIVLSSIPVLVYKSQLFTLKIICFTFLTILRYIHTYVRIEQFLAIYLWNIMPPTYFIQKQPIIKLYPLSILCLVK